MDNSINYQPTIYTDPVYISAGYKYILDKGTRYEQLVLVHYVGDPFILVSSLENSEYRFEVTKNRLFMTQI